MTNIWLYPGSGNPYNIVLADPTVQRGAVAISLALAVIDGSDLCASAVALVSASADLSLAATEGSDLASATARLAVSANLAASDGADLASGAVAAVVSSALSATEGADTFASNVALFIMASMAAVDGADLCTSAVDLVAGSADISLGVVEGADTCDALADDGTGQTDNQSFRIYNLRNKKRKPRVELVLDMDLTTAPAPIVPVTPLPEVASAPIRAAYKVTTLDLAMVRPMEIKVRPKPIYSPIQPLAVTTAEDERKKKSNHALRLLLLAS